MELVHGVRLERILLCINFHILCSHQLKESSSYNDAEGKVADFIESLLQYSASESYFSNSIRTLIYANEPFFVPEGRLRAAFANSSLKGFCACDPLHFRTYRKLFVKLNTPFQGPFTFDVDTPKVIVFGIKVLRRNINLYVVVADNILLLPNKTVFNLQASLWA